MSKSKGDRLVNHAASVARMVAARDTTSRPGIYSTIEQEFLAEGREGLETQLQKDFYDHLLKRATSEPGLNMQTVTTTQGVIPYLIDQSTIGIAANAQQNDLEIDSTILGAVSDIVKILPQPRPAQLKEGSIETSKRLKALGLFKAAEALDGKIREKTMGQRGYRLVSIESIKRFLQRKAEIYNLAKGQKIAVPIDDNSYAKTRTITAMTCDYIKGGGIGKFTWKETPIRDYSGIPPDHVLDALEKAKPDFDEIYVAEVVNLPDPILIGKLKDQIEGYYIPDSQWGDDVCLDDIV